MKYTMQILAAALLATTVAGGPLQKEQVSADAKWLLHLDVDQLRTTRVGEVLVKEVLEKNFSEPKMKLKNDLGFDLDVSRISSITAYGSDYGPGRAGKVLLIKTDLEFQKALDGAIEKFASQGDEVPVKKLEGDDAGLYSIHNEVFVAFLPGHLVAAGRSIGSVKKEAAVLSGKSPNIVSSKTFSQFPGSKKNSFFVASAESFNSDATIPPQAQILKMADGGQVVLGERGDNLFLSISLRAKTSEVVTQMQQAIQGFLALISLSQQGNKDLLQLAQSAKVSADDNIVSLSVEFPADSAIEHLREQHQHKSHREGDAEAEPESKKKDQ